MNQTWANDMQPETVGWDLQLILPSNIPNGQFQTAGDSANLTAVVLIHQKLDMGAIEPHLIKYVMENARKTIQHPRTKREH